MVNGHKYLKRQTEALEKIAESNNRMANALEVMYAKGLEIYTTHHQGIKVEVKPAE